MLHTRSSHLAGWIFETPMNAFVEPQARALYGHLGWCVLGWCVAVFADILHLTQEFHRDPPEIARRPVQSATMGFVCRLVPIQTFRLIALVCLLAISQW